jgi:signal transduction histidine kinase
MQDQNISTQQRELDIAIERFIAIASHKILSPITVIKWTVEILEQDVNLSPASLEKLSVISDNAERLEEFAHVLLSVSDVRKKNYYTTESILYNFSEILDDLLLEYKGLVEAQSISVKVNFDSGDKVKLNLDKEFLYEILRILIENSIYYNQKGGKVDINVSQSVEYLNFKISDTGMGVPDEEKDLLFRPFFRTSSSLKSEIKGYGLSLYYIQILMDKLGGKIMYTPNLPKGSIFEVNIPKGTV